MYGKLTHFTLRDDSLNSSLHHQVRFPHLVLKVPHRRRIRSVKKSDSLIPSLSLSEDSVNAVFTYISRLEV
jgi:hypothetical protein